MEINPVAGLHPKDSDLPIICSFFGMSYRELIEQIVAGARERLPSDRDRLTRSQRRGSSQPTVAVGSGLNERE